MSLKNQIDDMECLKIMFVLVLNTGDLSTRMKSKDLGYPRQAYYCNLVSKKTLTANLFGNEISIIVTLIERTK